MTREQEKARARKQREKFEKRQVEKAAEQKRNRQVIGVVVAVLAVIAIFIGVSTQLRGDDGEQTATPGSSETSPADTGATDDPTTPSDETTPSGEASVDGCEAAPSAPTEAKQLELPDKAAAEGKTFTATVTTNCGDIVLELDGAKAPQTVASFNALAEQGYYDDSPCHRLTTEGLYVLQCGDPTGTGSGGPGYGYGIENAPADGKYPPGTLAMARTSDPNSNGSQFFIVYQDTELPTDGGGYSIFGKVTQGLDLVEKIAGAGVSGGAADGSPAQPISILSVAVTEK